MNFIGFAFIAIFFVFIVLIVMASIAVFKSSGLDSWLSLLIIVICLGFIGNWLLTLLSILE